MALHKIQDDDEVIDFLERSMGKEKAYEALTLISGDVGKDKAIGFEKSNKQAALIYKFGNEKGSGLMAILGDTKEEILSAWNKTKGLTNIDNIPWNQAE